MVLLQAAPSWDLVIMLVIVIGVTYGFIMLRERVLVMLMSLYAGIILANSLADPIQKFFNGDVAFLNKLWVQSSASPFIIKIVIFGLVVAIINTKSGLTGKRSAVGYFELAAYSFFNACIGISAFFSFMEPDKLKAYTDTSKLANLIVTHQMLWLLAPLVVLAVMGGTRRSSNRYSDDY